MVGGHYRQPLQFDAVTMAQAAGRVRGIREVGRRLVDGASPAWSDELREEFFSALAEDFNTPAALAVVARWLAAAREAPQPVGRDALREMLQVLGLEGLVEAETAAPPELVELALAREEARAVRDWATADRLRDDLLTAGWTVRDGLDGPELVAAG